MKVSRVRVSKIWWVCPLCLGFSFSGYSDSISLRHSPLALPPITIDGSMIESIDEIADEAPQPTSNPELESSELYQKISKETDLDKRADLLQQATPEDLKSLAKLLKASQSPSDRALLEVVRVSTKVSKLSIREAFEFEPTTPTEKSAKKALLESFYGKYTDEDIRRVQASVEWNKKHQEEYKEIKDEKFHPDPAQSTIANAMVWNKPDKAPVEKLTAEQLEDLADKHGNSQGDIFIRVPKNLKGDSDLATSLNQAGLSLANDGYLLKMSLSAKNKEDALKLLNRYGLGSYLEKLIVPAETAEAHFLEQAKGWGKGKGFEQAASNIFTVVPTDGKTEAQRIFGPEPGKGEKIYPGIPQPRFSSKDYGYMMADVHQSIADTAAIHAQDIYEARKFRNGGEPNLAFVFAEIADSWQKGQKDIHPLDYLSAASFHRTPPSLLTETLAAPVMLGTLSAPFVQEKLREATSDYTPYLPFLTLFTGGYPDLTQFISELSKGSSRKK